MSLKLLNGIFGIDKKSYVLIDDCAFQIVINAANSILISPYLGNSSDNELRKLCHFLESKANSDDIRCEISDIFSFEDLYMK